jgi:SAM-dependent methyltransferase
VSEPPIDEARRRSFDGCAELYDAARPSYPDALVDDVIAAGGRRMLEIGPGTGKATVVFARRGASIVAIEPGPSLAAVLRRNVAGLDVVVEETTFEAWSIARREGSFEVPFDVPYDVVFAAQAIHWVDPAVRYAKSADVLAPGGTLAVVRNEKALLDPGLSEELDAVYTRWLPRYTGRPYASGVELARREIVDEIDASGRFGAVDVRLYPWTETYTTARYLELLDTYSDHATLARELRALLYRAIAEVLDRRGGVLEMPYVSMAFLARRL